jgi:hypothetical protein
VIRFFLELDPGSIGNNDNTFWIDLGNNQVYRITNNIYPNCLAFGYRVTPEMTGEILFTTNQMNGMGWLKDNFFCVFCF